MSVAFAAPGTFGPAATALVGLVGLIVGSFLNVVAYRLPRGESLAFPGSRCPSCGTPIKAYDNVPVLSWAFLGGRCRACRARIGVRYPALELSNAVLWALVFREAPTWADFATGAFLTSVGLVLFLIDLDFEILPDVLTLPGIAVGLALSFWSEKRTPAGALVGAALGAGGLWLLAFVYEKAAGHEGMGLGDVKMLGMAGALLGPAGMLFTIMAASLSGSIVGVALMLARGGDRKMRLRFGPFLALGAIAAWFFAGPLFARYRALWP
ncbi:MAG TPA: prepilin peptidase [Thermoanaerobaculia bacterium]|nr:prepilin peptidase [Thermoanaerobaculia bacterium]